ncbi:MAG TPA: beta-phosphoglucomutase family hydrolase [Acidimicrobiales bacterium]|nr:beta-phosphoglucomutase family hydrolase [Acidimicrobiales bacterium]
MTDATRGGRLGLPSAVRGCLFDMDGVLTRTAEVHAAAWKQTFDEFLRYWSTRTGIRARPFDAHDDYDRYVDGRSRADGTRGFLASRDIRLPEGDPDDPPGSPTVSGLSNRKNDILLEKLATDGVRVFDDAVEYVKAVRAAALPCAVVSASANTEQVLRAAGISDLFDSRVDGLLARKRHLQGKPAPDMYLAGAEALGLPPEGAAVFEDALAGVEAGRAGGFGFVVGVDRVGQGDDLRAHGADVVVERLTELLGAP